MMMWKAWMIVSGTGKCLDWQYPPVLLFVLGVQMFIVLILLQFSHKGVSTALSSWFLGFTCALPPICTLTFACHSNPSEHSWYYLAHPTGQIFNLIWWEPQQAATSAKVLKHSKVVHLLCKFHSHAHSPGLLYWFKSLKLIIS